MELSTWHPVILQRDGDRKLSEDCPEGSRNGIYKAVIVRATLLKEEPMPRLDYTLVSKIG